MDSTAASLVERAHAAIGGSVDEHLAWPVRSSPGLALTGEHRNVDPPPTTFVLPPPGTASPGNDLVGIGADLAPGTLLAGFRLGLFPLPVDPRRRRSRLAWYSPDPRGVLPLDGLRVPRSLRRSMRRFEVRMDTDPVGVVHGCADPSRPGRWITEEFADAYLGLFRLGWMRTVDVYERGRLVGGLFGVRLDGCFVGVSMFHRVTDASKVALVHLVEWLRHTDATLLDVQWPTPHLASLGVVEIDRSAYLRDLAAATD